MLKRIMFTLMALLAIYSGAVVVYLGNKPELAETSAFAQNSGSTLYYDTLRDYTLNSGASATHYYFFCTSEDNNCAFVEDTVIRDTERETGLTLSSLIEYVDITDLVENMDYNRLYTDWTVSSFPAFVAVKNDNGEIKIENTLEWTDDNPISSQTLTSWLELNKLYNTPSPTSAAQ